MCVYGMCVHVSVCAFMCIDVCGVHGVYMVCMVCVGIWCVCVCMYVLLAVGLSGSPLSVSLGAA